MPQFFKKKFVNGGGFRRAFAHALTCARLVGAPKLVFYLSTPGVEASLNTSDKWCIWHGRSTTNHRRGAAAAAKTKVKVSGDGNASNGGSGSGGGSAVGGPGSSGFAGVGIGTGEGYSGDGDGSGSAAAGVGPYF